MPLPRTPLLTALALSLVATPALAFVDPGVGSAAPRLAPVVAVAPQQVALVAAEESDEAAGAELGRRVRAALAGSGATTVSVAVDVAGFDSVVRTEAGHALPPASTQKSYTGLSALLALGGATRLTTQVAATATAVQGRLPGPVWLVAGGDPYLTSTGLRVLARAVKLAGVTTIAGDVLLDDSRYDARRNVSGWKSGYVPDESGPLSALSVDRNTWRRDSAFLRDPALPNTVKFRDFLRAEGVTVIGTVRRSRVPDTAAVLAQAQSGPLTAVVRRALKASDNFASELLLKELGHAVRGTGSSAAGIEATRQVLGGLGVPVGTGTDGSGLSSADRQSPAAQVALLRAADASGSAAAFRAALPIGCTDGTLKKRFCGTAASGRVFAKTGTLPGVRALAGFTTTESGRTVWFAFQLTGVKDGNAVKAIDRAVVVLAGARE